MKPSELFDTTRTYLEDEVSEARPTRNFYTYYTEGNMDVFGFSNTSNIYLYSVDIADFYEMADEPNVPPEELDNHRLSAHYNYEGNN